MCTHLMRTRSRMTIASIPSHPYNARTGFTDKADMACTKPGRSSLGFHRLGRHRACGCGGWGRSLRPGTAIPPPDHSRRYSSGPIKPRGIIAYYWRKVTLRPSTPATYPTEAYHSPAVTSLLLSLAFSRWCGSCLLPGTLKSIYFFLLSFFFFFIDVCRVLSFSFSYSLIYVPSRSYFSLKGCLEDLSDMGQGWHA